MLRATNARRHRRAGTRRAGRAAQRASHEYGRGDARRSGRSRLPHPRAGGVGLHRTHGGGRCRRSRRCRGLLGVAGAAQRRVAPHDSRARRRRAGRVSAAVRHQSAPELLSTNGSSATRSNGPTSETQRGRTPRRGPFPSGWKVLRSGLSRSSSSAFRSVTSSSPRAAGAAV